MQPKFTPSFGRRKARKLREMSQRAYEAILPQVRLELPLSPFVLSVDPEGAEVEGPKDYISSFDFPEKLLHSGRTASVQSTPPEIWLEIGFGGGEHLLEQLAHNPDIIMVGCEPFMNGVAKLLSHLAPEDYDRVCIWHEDVRYLLDHVPPATFARAFILFPDPWPKKRHQPRRLITSEFMEKLLPTLMDGAHLRVASDDVSYVEQIQEVLYDHPALTRLEGPPSADPATWTPRPDGWPMTRYEQKAVTQGKKCAYMVFQKKQNACQ